MVSWGLCSQRLGERRLRSSKGWALRLLLILLICLPIYLFSFLFFLFYNSEHMSHCWLLVYFAGAVLTFCFPHTSGGHTKSIGSLTNVVKLVDDLNTIFIAEPSNKNALYTRECRDLFPGLQTLYTGLPHTWFLPPHVFCSVCAYVMGAWSWGPSCLVPLLNHHPPVPPHTLLSASCVLLLRLFSLIRVIILGQYSTARFHTGYVSHGDAWYANRLKT